MLAVGPADELYHCLWRYHHQNTNSVNVYRGAEVCSFEVTEDDMKAFRHICKADAEGRITLQGFRLIGRYTS